ncbi:hypothetical protein K488DRAFT_25437, partial [Vararia minispora EC-137]
PPEVLDSIVACIDTRCDVLAFALVCRAFYAVAIPRHSEYRALRAPYADINLWRHLTERPDLAAGLRAVNVLER